MKVMVTAQTPKRGGTIENHICGFLAPLDIFQYSLGAGEEKALLLGPASGVRFDQGTF